MFDEKQTGMIGLSKWTRNLKKRNGCTDLQQCSHAYKLRIDNEFLLLVYSRSQKECPKSLNKKSMAKIVKFSEILHASSYGLYECMYKAKNLPRLVRGH